MAKSVLLKASARAGIGRTAVKKLRQTGRVPAVLYGKRIKPTPLDVNSRELSSVIHASAGENVLVDLEFDLEGAPQKRLALIQDVQQDAISGAYLHLDLHEIAADETIRAHVPVDPTGEPIGVKTYGGILEHILRELNIECLPKDLPDRILVDVSGLNVNQSVHVNEIVVPDGVTVLNPAELVVFAVAPPLTEDKTATEAAAAVQPEVLKEKKPAEGEAPKADAKKK
jgi:large subunit ribosomal protein L25